MKSLLTCCLLLFCICSYSQNDVLLVPSGTNLPPDSITRIQLLGSLRGFLGQKDGASYVLPEDLAAVSALKDELRGMERRVGPGPHDTSYYKCYLTNVLPVDSGVYHVQLAYMGVKEAAPDLRICCRVVAKQKGERFYFSTPIEGVAFGWKKKVIGNCVFHYKTEISEKRAREYQQKVAYYDGKLTKRPQAIDFYCCDNLAEATRLVGIEYKADYNGWAHEELSGFAADRSVVLCGFDSKNGFPDWDTHDTWHGRLHNMVPVETINRPVDEACAYLYGGSWRIYQWEDVLRLFKEYAAAHPDADWVSLYKEGTNFIPPPKILKISYAINALIVRRLEKEKGFGAVRELLMCGKKEVGDANYFAAVRRLTGVDVAGYNAYVWGLIKANN
ncbi:MAG: hypothetical protein JST68_05925 [Bacteroidetes bacterium]|nr:hypothetical protein [Bacteroidota bacterium]